MVAQLHAFITLAQDKAEWSASDLSALCTGKDLPLFAGEKVEWTTEQSFMYWQREKSPLGTRPWSCMLYTGVAILNK